MSGRRRERGAVLVLFAATLPVLVVLGAFMLDVGNWYAHQRQLQVRADAGALAAAGRFAGFCSDSAVYAEARRYSGVGYTGSFGTFNVSTASPQGKLFSAINSKTFYGQTSPVDTSVVEKAPCSASMVDIKLTETNLPWLLKKTRLVPFINAQARVEVRARKTQGGALPVGVPDVGPKAVRAILVNETTGTEIASTNLTATGTSSDGLALWSNAASPLPVTVNTSKIGVRVALSDGTSTTCGTALVDCYGAGSTSAITAGSPGLSFVRGYATTPAGTTTAPQVRGVTMVPVLCEDGSFTTLATYPCTVNVSAFVDVGTGTNVLNGFRVLAKKTGTNDSTAVELTAPSTSTGAWVGGAFSIASASGATSFDLLYQTGCPTNRATSCNKTLNSLGTVQRTYAGSETLTASGPIKRIAISENGTPGQTALTSCATCVHNLVVTVGLKAGLKNASSLSDPVVSLKVAGGGSQNQALDCDPALSNFRDQLASGCAPLYIPNTTNTACPAKTTLWAGPQPWKCVVISTGASVGQVTQGLNQRFLGSTNANTCTAPNNWSKFPNLPAGDKRVVSVFVTPFAAFSGSGGATVPVTNFATFYVTGWDGGACQGKGDDPAGAGAIVGHYIKYIDTLSPSEAGSGFCDLNALGSCVTVFTR